MTPGEQKLVDEAYAAIIRASRACPGMTKYAHRAMNACGDLLERYSTLNEAEIPEPKAAGALMPTKRDVLEELLVSLRRADSLLDAESPWKGSVQKFSEHLGADLREREPPPRPRLTLVGAAT